MQEYSESAIQASTEAIIAYCKFIVPNDVGSTGSHQSGFYVHKEAFRIMFNEPGVRGQNKEREVIIRWQDDFETRSSFKYYGQETRNEYRITRFGRGFPFLTRENIGNLLVLCKVSDEFYSAYILETEYEIENFLNYFNISPAEANSLVGQTVTSSNLESLIAEYVNGLDSSDDFPSTQELSEAARSIFGQVADASESLILENPDSIITDWIDTEYSLFRAVETSKYSERLTQPFEKVDPLVEFANRVLNRRKSRAGRSLENHLAKIFDVYNLPYSAQKVTEGHKKPDFIIPGIEQYHDESYSVNKLVFLGAKTTCKDRWRQIINEAARTPVKHLFTLQPGISSNQLQEMRSENIVLVVPEKNLTAFPIENREEIMTLKKFINYSKERVV